MKRQVWRAVLHGQEVVGNAEEFAAVASERCPKIKVNYALNNAYLYCMLVVSIKCIKLTLFVIIW